MNLSRYLLSFQPLELMISLPDDGFSSSELHFFLYSSHAI